MTIKYVAFNRHYLQARYFKKYRIAIMSYIKNVTDSDIIPGYPTSYCTTVKHHIHHMKDIEYDIFEIKK